MNLLPKPYRPTVGYPCGPQSQITTALDRLAFRASDWIGDWIERLTPPAAIELGNILVERYVPLCAAHRAHFIAPTAIAEPAPAPAPIAIPEPLVAPIVAPETERMEPAEPAIPLIRLRPGPPPRSSQYNYVMPKPDPAPIAVDWPITHKETAHEQLFLQNV